MTNKQKTLDEVFNQEGYKIPYIFQREGQEIPEEWSVHRLEEILELEYGKNLPKKDREDGSYPVYGSNGRTGWHSEAHVDGPGIIVGRKGSLEVTWSNQDYNAIDTAYYINNDSLKIDDINLFYLYYMLLEFDFQRLETGSAVPSLSRDDFYDETIALPTLPEQQKIADTLHKFDAKIQTNEDINELLEDVAWQIYRSRFIEFEDYEQFIESELGDIPQSFTVVEFKEICNTSSGGPRKNTDDYIGDVHKWMTTKDATSNNISTIYETERRLNEKAIEESATNLMEPGSVFLTSRATIGEVIINKEPMATNQGYIRLKPGDNIPSHYLLQLIKSKRKIIENRATGSTYPELSQRGFESISVPLAPTEDRYEYENEVSPMYDIMYENLRQNKTLLEIRNTLLPELMTGGVRLEPDIKETETG